MNNALIALMLAAGVAGFVYTKVGRNTGNADPKQTYLVAGLVGAIAFVVTLVTLNMFI